MKWDKCLFTPQSEENIKNYQKMLSNNNNNNTHDLPPPPFQVTQPMVCLPGHIKVIEDFSGPTGSFLIHLYTSRAQAEQLGPDGPLHHALYDLEWIGKDCHYQPHIHNNGK